MREFLPSPLSLPPNLLLVRGLASAAVRVVEKTVAHWRGVGVGVV